MYFSQQITAPGRPAGLSTTSSVDPSPKPQTRRSTAVGMSFRCLPTTPLCGSIITAVQ